MAQGQIERSRRIVHDRYVARVSHDGERFHGVVVNCDDQIDFDAESEEELEREFAASVGAYEDFCRQQGREPRVKGTAREA